MIATIIAIVLLGGFIFLLGRLIGQHQHEAHIRESIRENGLFQLNNGFYYATKVGFEPDEVLQTVNPFRQFINETHHDVTDLPDTSTPPKKTIRRRAALNTH